MTYSHMADVGRGCTQFHSTLIIILQVGVWIAEASASVPRERAVIAELARSLGVPLERVVSSGENLTA